FALASGNTGPVIRVGGVGHVFVFGEFFAYRTQQVLHLQAALLLGDQCLDGVLLGPVHDVVDDRAGGKVLEIEHFGGPGDVGDFQDLVDFLGGVHRLHGPADHAFNGGTGIFAVRGQLLGVQRQIGGQVLAEDLCRSEEHTSELQSRANLVCR